MDGTVIEGQSVIAWKAPTRNRTRRTRRWWRTELSAEEVIIHRDDDRLIVEPVSSTPSLAEVLATLTPLEEDFPVIADPPSEPEDIF